MPRKRDRHQWNVVHGVAEVAGDPPRHMRRQPKAEPCQPLGTVRPAGLGAGVVAGALSRGTMTTRIVVSVCLPCLPLAPPRIPPIPGTVKDNSASSSVLLLMSTPRVAVAELTATPRSCRPSFAFLQLLTEFRDDVAQLSHIAGVSACVLGRSWPVPMVRRLLFASVVVWTPGPDVPIPVLKRPHHRTP
jgi:hypothetical protein